MNTPASHILSRKTVVFQNTVPTINSLGDSKWYMPFKFKEGDTVYAAYTHGIPFFEDSTINKKVEECLNKTQIRYSLDKEDDIQMSYSYDKYSTDHRLKAPNTPFIYLGKTLNIIYDYSFIAPKEMCMLKFFDINKTSIKWFADYEIKKGVIRGFEKTLKNSLDYTKHMETKDGV